MRQTSVPVFGLVDAFTSDAPRGGVAAAATASAHLGGAEAELAGFDLASYYRVERREHRFATNWKLTIDSFMEAYHLHFLHAETLRPIFHGNLSAFDAFGRNCRIVGVRRSFDDMEDGASLLPHVQQLAKLAKSELLLVHVADGWVARNFNQLKLAESEEMKADRAYLETTAARLRKAGLE